MLNYYHDGRRPAEDTMVALCDACAEVDHAYLSYLGIASDVERCEGCDGPAEDAQACAWFARQRRARHLAERLGLSA